MDEESTELLEGSLPVASGTDEQHFGSTNGIKPCSFEFLKSDLESASFESLGIFDSQPPNTPGDDRDGNGVASVPGPQMGRSIPVLERSSSQPSEGSTGTKSAELAFGTCTDSVVTLAAVRSKNDKLAKDSRHSTSFQVASDPSPPPECGRRRNTVCSDTPLALTDAVYRELSRGAAQQQRFPPSTHNIFSSSPSTCCSAIAALSSSTVLAMLPLRACDPSVESSYPLAGGGDRSVPSPFRTVAERTEEDVDEDGGKFGLDDPSSSSDRSDAFGGNPLVGGRLSGSAALTWDRRSSFFTEPVKTSATMPARCSSQHSVFAHGQPTISLVAERAKHFQPHVEPMAEHVGSHAPVTDSKVPTSDGPFRPKLHFGCESVAAVAGVFERLSEEQVPSLLRSPKLSRAISPQRQTAPPGEFAAPPTIRGVAPVLLQVSSISTVTASACVEPSPERIWNLQVSPSQLCGRDDGNSGGIVPSGLRRVAGSAGILEDGQARDCRGEMFSVNTDSVFADSLLPGAIHMSQSSKFFTLEIPFTFSNILFSV